MGKTKVALFGGSFDPIHNGHLALADEALSRGLADEVWFMVTPQNPHKQGSTLSDEQLRLQMVQLAIEGKRGVVASDFEFTLPRPSVVRTRSPDKCPPQNVFSTLSEYGQSIPARPPTWRRRG